ncbi:MAG: substrate-binding domain-containing protein [Raoultibacter sp.]|jgi:phosphate transport system substrate-binding protein
MSKSLDKRLVGLVACVALVMGMLCFVGCSSAPSSSSKQAEDSKDSPTGQVSVYSREDGSGTRGAFIELFEIEEKDSSGEKVDKTTTSAVITNSTSVMMTSIASDENGIGYLSLGSLDSSVSAVKIDDVEATAENVKNGSYKAARPFNIATKDNLSDVAQDFISFTMSADGQAIVEENGYIAIDGETKNYSASGKSGKIVIAGSSSVTPVMEKLQEAYMKLNPDVSIEVQQSDSTTGMNMAIEGTCDIGMASRELKDSELSSGLKATAIALDGIAVIVHTNSSIENLSSEQVKGIYTGEISDWEEVRG